MCKPRFAMVSRSYTTAEVVDKLGVTRATIQKWIKIGAIQPPAIQTRDRKPPVRLWSNSDVDKLRRVKREMKTKMEIGRPRKDAKK